MTAMNNQRTVVVNDALSFEVAEGEIILDAALSQGVVLPHQCRGASCGMCKAQVTRGAIDNGWSLGLAISDQEIADGFCLMCQARPLSAEVCLRTVQPIPGGEGSAVRSFEAHVLCNTPLTPRVRRLVVQLPASARFEAPPGAYIELALPGLFPHRRYSLASMPEAGSLIELLVARHPGGAASGHIHDLLRAGDTVGVTGPYGTCRLPEGEGAVLGLAGGTGLAPVLSIMEDALAHGDRSPMTLLFSVRDDSELMLMDRLAGLARTHSNFRYELLVTEACSRFCAKRQYAPSWLRENHGSLHGVRAVIGGSPGFVAACSDTCISLGMAPSAISADSFTPVAQT
jgi:ferredoxin-NADP reductase/ferredoxin